MKLQDQRLGAYKKILASPEENAERDERAKPDERSKPDSRIKPDARAHTTNAASAAGTPTSARTSTSVGTPTVAHAAGAAPKANAPRTATSLPGLVKVPSSDRGGKDSPYRKVAKFLLLIGVEEAAKVMSKLTQEQTEKVVLELATIRHVDKDEAAIVLAEFESLLSKAREPEGGLGTARSILEAAFGSERADEMLRKAVPDMGVKPFDYLDGIDPDRVYRLIGDELPAIKALVLSQMKPKSAATVISLMRGDEKKETVLRLAKMKTIDPETVRRVDGAMREKVEAIGSASDDAIDGRSALAQILKHMDGSSENSILRGISDADPDLGKDLRERLFTVEDIIGADDKFIQTTLRPMAERDLAVLIAGKDERFRAKILGNVSKTRGAIVLEEEKLALPVSRAESEKITGAFFSTMRRAWESGELFVAGRDKDEVWV